ncbi:MAG: 50S ribosomal protein L21 [Bacteroidetes bacterium]|nr:50S ribosomal protein L21 [Bacteroidota bacterium]
MYAIVTIAGQQFKVEKGQEIFVHRLDGKTGDKIELKDVLLLDDNGKVVVGTPKVDNAKLMATIQDHVKGDKVIVFKRKRRKGYRVRNGHRQSFTKIMIDDILTKSGQAPKAVKKEEATKTTKEEVVPKVEAKAKKDTPAKKATETKKAAPGKKTE